MGGFNTEANLLNFPEGASLDEENCELLNDGSRKRRQGFNTDLGTPVDTGVTYPSGQRLGKNQYIWKNVGGIPDEEFLVVQLGNYIGIHDLSSSVISDNLVYSFTIDEASTTQSFGLTSVDGILIIATGEADVWNVQYDGENFTRSSGRLLVRDFWGVEAGTLTDPQNVQVRPPAPISSPHLYNLRNQTFAIPRVDPHGSSLDLRDPISFFRDTSVSEIGQPTFPSNADNVNLHLRADPNATSNRTIERFDPVAMFKNAPQNTKAPMGYFIIDALNRGESRQSEFLKLTDRHPELRWRSTVSLPTDRTPGGAKIVSQYAGRVWFAGFSGDVQNGDKKSPKMSSYILFSQVVKEPSQIYWCFQSADPTSHIDADLVTTDGGFIKIDGAYNIVDLVVAESSLFVFAENGVWRIVGVDENTFNATSYTVNKLSDNGCVAKGSVVYVDGLLLYWSESAIYTISKDRFGAWAVADITDATIKTFYQGLSTYERENCSGYYDDATGTIRWLYGEDPEYRSEVGELVLNKKFQVFTKNRINLIGETFGPVAISGGRLSSGAEVVVTVEGEAVTVEDEVVTTPYLYSFRSASQNLYCNLTRLYPTMTYTFGGYNSEETPTDWLVFGGVDTPAYLTTGFITGGEGRLTKDVPYLSTYFNILEEPSSCFLQTRWDWTTGPSSGQWTAPRQIYRDNLIRTGDSSVVTRNKIRGFGKSLAFNFSSEPGKFFHIYGWEHNLEATTDE